MSDHITIQQATALANRKVRNRAQSVIGRLTKSELVDTVLDALFDFIKLADKFIDVPGQDKKKWVLARISDLADRLLPLVPLPWFLQPFRAWLTKRAKAEIMDLANLAVETILKHLREAAK